jgi:hypothetical protein
MSNLNKLDKFTEDICMKESRKVISENQIDLTRSVRGTFNNDIRNSNKKSEKKIILNFPENLWIENRKKIVNELIERYGTLCIESSDEKNLICSKIYVSDNNDLSNIERIDNVEIEFWK